MNSLAYIPASDGAANASLMTVTNVRAGGATTIQVNTVANAPTKFYGSTGTPNTFTDPVTGETITVISEATAVDFAGTIDGSNVEIVEIAPGYTDAGSQVGDIVIIRPVTEWANNLFNTLSAVHEDDGTLKDDVVDTAALQDKAVTSEKTDPNVHVIDFGASNTTLNHTSYLTVGSVTIPAADIPGDSATESYEITVNVAGDISWNGNSTNLNDAYTRVYIDGVHKTDGNTQISKPGATSYHFPVAVAYKTTVSAGEDHTISIRTQMNNSMSGVYFASRNLSQGYVRVEGKV